VPGWSLLPTSDSPDVSGDYPGEMRFLAHSLDCEQLGFTYRRMLAGTGGKGSYGHHHHTQEEIYYVLSGPLLFKLGDAIVEAGPLTAIRIAPEVVRSVWNEGPEDAELIMCSTRTDDLRAETELVQDFWPAE